MQSKDFADELLDQLDQQQVPLPTIRDDGVPAIECDADDHPGDEVVREGNPVAALVVRSDADDDDEWEVKNTCCKRCSMRDIFERVSAEKVTAVVEGELAPAESWDTDDLCLHDAVVWDIHNPTAQ